MECLVKVLSSTPLAFKGARPLERGIFLHITDIFLSELFRALSVSPTAPLQSSNSSTSKTSKGFSQDTILVLLEPFVQVCCHVQDDSILKKVLSGVFVPLVSMLQLYCDALEERKGEDEGDEGNEEEEQLPAGGEAFFEVFALALPAVCRRLFVAASDKYLISFFFF